MFQNQSRTVMMAGQIRSSDKGMEKPARDKNKNNFNFNLSLERPGSALKHKPQPTSDQSKNVTPKGMTRAETNNYLINLNSKF